MSETQSVAKRDVSDVASVSSFTISDEVVSKNIQNLGLEILNCKSDGKALQIEPRIFKATNSKITTVKKAEITKQSRSKSGSLKSIIKSAENHYQIQNNLLLAIAKVETGIRPYTINYNGQGYFFKNVNDAVNFAKNLIQRGQTNFSVGCFQLHYPSHKSKFKTLYDMFDPKQNTTYAAKLLKKLYTNKGYNWERAIKAYHSGCAELNNIYYTKVTNNLGRSI